jgi:CRISPR system Cascade subunit CasD
MSVLLLRLAAPLQSWGIASKYNHRHTQREPTKSGIVGLLAAASGRRRNDPIEDLAQLRLGIRLDQPGELHRDYHTAASLPRQYTADPAYRAARRSVATLPTHRWYLTDALFLAAVEAPQPLLTTIDATLRHPAFPLYLGRRSCPPTRPLSLGLRDADIDAAFATEPWQASASRRRREGRRRLSLHTVVDDPTGDELVNDLPLSFDPLDRRYGWRRVRRGRVVVTNPDGKDDEQDPAARQTDPFDLLRW